MFIFIFLTLWERQMGKHIKQHKSNVIETCDPAGSHIEVLSTGAWSSLGSVKRFVDPSLYQEDTLVHTHSLTLRQNWLMFTEHCLLLSFQNSNDNKEQVMKKRKKKDANDLEEKDAEKNKEPSQGWVITEQYHCLFLWLSCVSLWMYSHSYEGFLLKWLTRSSACCRVSQSSTHL